MTTARQSEVKAWEQELQPCQHTLDLTQLESKALAQSGGYSCHLHSCTAGTLTTTQASHTARHAISPGIYGFASLVEISIVEDSNTAG